MCTKGLNLKKITTLKYDGDLQEGLKVLITKYPDHVIETIEGGFDLYETV